MFLFVNPKTNKEEFTFRFSTLKEAQEKRKQMGYDFTNLHIKLVADWKEPLPDSFYYSNLSAKEFFKKEGQ